MEGLIGFILGIIILVSIMRMDGNLIKIRQILERLEESQTSNKNKEKK